MFSYYASYSYKYVNFYLMLKDIFFRAKQKSSVNFVSYNGIIPLKIKKECTGVLCRLFTYLGYKRSIRS